MMQQDKSARDTFTLSLGGMRTINSFAIVPVIAHDALRQNRDGRTHSSRGKKSRSWVPRFLRVA